MGSKPETVTVTVYFFEMFVSLYQIRCSHEPHYSCCYYWNAVH